METSKAAVMKPKPQNYQGEKGIRQFAGIAIDRGRQNGFGKERVPA